LAALKEDPLFQDYLLPDIAKGDVFPAVRYDDMVDFYHAGGRLFQYRNREFNTHTNYLLTQRNPHCPYLTELHVSDLKRIGFFADEYEHIKGRAHQGLSRGRGRVERGLVGQICSGFRQLMKVDTSSAVQVVPLDVEVAFRKGQSESGAKRIDLVLLNLRSGRLRFCEVKRGDSTDLDEPPTGKPKVANQLNRYRDQVHDNNEQIPREYSNHLAILQSLLPMSLPPHPKLEVDPTWPIFLLVLGEPGDEKLRDKLRSRHLERYPCLVRSDAASIDLAELRDEVDLWPGAAGRAGL